MDPNGEAEATLTAAERAELSRLRAENALLRTEKDILLKAATRFAIDAGALRPRAAGKPESR
jgi:transposase